MKKSMQEIVDSFPRIREIEAENLREKVCSAWLHAWEFSDYERLEDASQWEPVREELGISNVAHTNGVVECALAMADSLQATQNLNVNRDFLIAAAVLHDLDKICLFRASDGQPTALGRQLGHVATGVHLALTAGLPLEVVHAIAAHSSNYSKILPQNIEALILKAADELFTRTWIMQRGKNISFEMP